MKKIKFSLVLQNPFYLLLSIYLLANIYSIFILLSGSMLKVDSEEFIYSEYIILISACAIFFSFLLLFIFYRVANRPKLVKFELSFSSRWGRLLVLIQISYIIYNYYYGINIAGVEDKSQGNAGFGALFMLLQPDILYLLIATGLKSDRLFWINSVIFIISSFMRAWLGAPILLLVLLMTRRSTQKINIKKVILIFILLVLGALLLPLAVSVKWFLRSGGGFEEGLDFLLNIGYFKYLFESFDYVANRFQLFGHVALLATNSESMAVAYEANKFIPYWMDGAPQSMFYKMMGADAFQLNKYMVRSLFGSNNLVYATNPGLAGWFFVLQSKSVFFISYLIFIALILPRYVLKHAGLKYFSMIMCFTLIYLFHGWIAAYFNLMLYLLFFIFVRRVASYHMKSKIRNKYKLS